MPMPDLSVPTLTVVPWRDPVIDALGYPPGSTYVERFWLAILGPSTTWLVRHLDARLAAEPDGTTIELDATAAALGLGVGMGRHSPLVRALHRSCQFGLARAAPEAHLAVRRHLPPLTRHQVERLPPSIRARHHEWRATERDAGVLDPQLRRARHMALGLAELGEDVATTAQRLIRFDVHPVVAHDAAAWADRLVRARSDPAPSSPPSSSAPSPPRPTSLASVAESGLRDGAAEPPLPQPPGRASRRRPAPPIPGAPWSTGTSSDLSSDLSSSSSDDAA